MGVIGLDADPKTSRAPYVGESRLCGALAPNAEGLGAADGPDVNLGGSACQAVGQGEIKQCSVR